MTRRERMRATLAGEPTDRPPVSLWRHFYDREGTAEGLAQAMLEFQSTYDWDFMKVNPRGSYHIEDWGARTQRPGTGPLDKPKVVEGVIRRPEDWDRIRPLDVTKGAFGEHLDAEERIAAKIQGDVDWVMTVFNPVSVAADLVNDDALFVEHLRRHGERVHAALRAIADTFAAFTRETMARGASGIFLATTDWANDTRIKREEVEEFGRPYDLRVLAEAAAGPLNTLHVCGPGAYLREHADYPVAILSWDARDRGNPSIRGMRGATEKTLMTGISHEGAFLKGPAKAVEEEARSAVQESGGTRFILGPGCAIPAASPKEHYAIVREAALACA
ncbi:MAG TPA: uroporphyrinogen decarboxylase family protein [Candidatus Limnocylindrales bacterium]|nr:uroporphyrinogen decarboxylase family protein [Candidatus Limnocylindrales bacterium]